MLSPLAKRRMRVGSTCRIRRPRSDSAAGSSRPCTHRGRSACREQSSDRKILVDVRPVNACAATQELPVGTRGRGGVLQPGEPSQWYHDRASISKQDAKRFSGEAYIHRHGIDFHGTSRFKLRAPLLDPHNLYIFPVHVQIVCTTTSTTGALDGRYHDLHARPRELRRGARSG